jgi:DME family drug/metabolite transporter
MLFARALRYIAGATGVTLALGEPVTAFALAVLVVGERPRAIAFVGLALVLAGLAIVVWREVRGAPAASAAPARGAPAAIG